MSPRFPINDERDGHNAAFVCFGNFAEQPSMIVHLAHLCDLGLDKFVASVARSLHSFLPKNFISVLMVVRWRHSLQIVKAWVPFVSVLMVNLPSIGNWAAKCLPNFYMNLDKFLDSILAKIDTGIFVRRRYAANFGLEPSSIRSIANASYAPKIANFVKSLIFNNRLPLFHALDYSNGMNALQGQL